MERSTGLRVELQDRRTSESGTLTVQFQDGSPKLQATLTVARSMYVAWPSKFILESTPVGLNLRAPHNIMVNSVDMQKKGAQLTQEVKSRQLLELKECKDGRYRVRLRYSDTSMNWYVAGSAPTSELGEVSTEEFVLVVRDGEGYFYHKRD